MHSVGHDFTGTRADRPAARAAARATAGRPGEAAGAGPAQAPAPRAEGGETAAAKKNREYTDPYTAIAASARRLSPPRAARAARRGARRAGAGGPRNPTRPPPRRRPVVHSLHASRCDVSRIKNACETHESRYDIVNTVRRPVRPFERRDDATRGGRAAPGPAEPARCAGPRTRDALQVECATRVARLARPHCMCRTRYTRYTRAARVRRGAGGWGVRARGADLLSARRCLSTR